jgi:hypothetical protein
MLACALRRHEVVALILDHLQQRKEHWAIVDLVGKGQRPNRSGSRLGEKYDRRVARRCRNRSNPAERRPMARSREPQPAPAGAQAGGDWARYEVRPRWLDFGQKRMRSGWGQVFPQVLGWMVHVYPFEQKPEDIWSVERQMEDHRD